MKVTWRSDWRSELHYIFMKEDLQNYLADYLDYNPSDRYFRHLYQKIEKSYADSRYDLTEEEIEAIQDLQKEFSEDLLLVELKLKEDNSEIILPYAGRIKFLMEQPLYGWDNKFINGSDTNRSLLERYEENHALTEKQLAQLNRIYKKYAIDNPF